MMKDFSRILELRVPRTLLGNGASERVGSLAREIGGRRILVLTDEGVRKAGHADLIGDSIRKQNLPFEVFSKCLPNVTAGTFRECCDLVRKGEFDLIVGLGGGSVMDMAKLVSLLSAHGGDTRVLYEAAAVKTRGLPVILLPTTSGTGSEWSNVAVFTDERQRRKRPIHSDKLWADAAIIDPVLTLNLPPSVTAETGMDALSHAIEAYTSWKANLIADLFAEKAINLISENLRIAYAKGSKHPDARHQMAIAAGLAMLALRSSGSYVVHAFSYPLGTETGLSHGAACSLMLPYVMEFSLIGNLDKFARIAHLMGDREKTLSVRERAQKAVDAVRSLSTDLGLKQRLSEVGITEKHIPEMTDYVFKFHSYQIESNPRDLTKEDMYHILRHAL